MKNGKMVRVSSKGQVVLPKHLREAMGIKEGDYLAVAEVADGVVGLAKTRSDLFDAIAEPFRREAAEQGITPDDIMKTIKSMRKERQSNAA